MSRCQHKMSQAINNTTGYQATAIKGAVYLIQPVELIGTDRYKVGYCNLNTVEVIKSNIKDAAIICLISVDNPIEVDKQIIKEFSSKFLLQAGRKYFRGNAIEMYSTFSKIVCDSIGLDFTI